MTENNSLIKELSEEQELKLESNLVWVFASPRSGTKWLSNQLLSYQTLAFNEPYIGYHLASIGIFRENSKNSDFHRNRNTYFFSKYHEKTWKFFLRKLILNRIFSQFQNVSKKIIIKEPNGSQGADIIVKCLPLSKIIFLIRDGRDVVDSALDARKENSWGTRLGITPVQTNTRIPLLRELARKWQIRTNLLMNVFENHPSELRYKLRYEDLRKNTALELKKLYDFLDIRITAEKIKELVEKFSFEKIPEGNKGSGKPTRFATPGKWKENFSHEEK